jgi:hypothetical protein
MVCQAVRAPGSKVTVAPPTRASPLPLNGASILTLPVKYCSGPFAEGCEPFRVISMCTVLPVVFILVVAAAISKISRTPTPPKPT